MTAAERSFARHSFSKVTPSAPGSQISSKTKSGFVSSQARRAESPSAAAVT